MRTHVLLLVLFVSNALAQEPTPVTTKPLSQALIERRLTANAQVQPLNHATLSAEVSAVVQAIHADVGQTVQAGDLLVSLDATDLKLQLQQAKANVQAATARLQQAELRLKRARDLSESQYISADDLLARETELAVQKADKQRLIVAQKSAQRQLDKTQIKAPFAGVVTDRQAQLGQLLTMGAPVLNLSQTDATEISAEIPAHLAASLIRADRMVFESLGQSIPVSLIVLSPIVNPDVSIQTARLQPQGLIKIGLTGQLVWYLDKHLLAADLILKRDGRFGVFVVNADQAKFMPLDAAQAGRPVPIDPSLDWQLIINGRERLQDGDPIVVKSQ